MLTIFISYSAYQIHYFSLPDVFQLAFKYVLCFLLRPVHSPLDIINPFPSIQILFILQDPVWILLLWNSCWLAQLIIAFLCVLVSCNSCHSRDILKHQVSIKGRSCIYWNLSECFLLSITKNLVREGSSSQWENAERCSQREECKTWRCFYDCLLRHPIGVIVRDCYQYKYYYYWVIYFLYISHPKF